LLSKQKTAGTERSFGIMSRRAARAPVSIGFLQLEDARMNKEPRSWNKKDNTEGKKL
jgi:hypothetical protein